MTDNFRKILGDERKRFVAFVRRRIAEDADFDAEDIVQDVFLRLLDNSNRVAPLENLSAYIYRALRNRIIDVARAGKPMLRLDGEQAESLAATLVDQTPDLAARLQTEQGVKMLAQALDQLSTVERLTIIAHEFEGESFKSLSSRMDMPINTLISHKARGLKKLKVMVRDAETTK